MLRYREHRRTTIIDTPVEVNRLKIKLRLSFTNGPFLRSRIIVSRAEFPFTDHSLEVF